MTASPSSQSDTDHEQADNVILHGILSIHRSPFLQRADSKQEAQSSRNTLPIIVVLLLVQSHLRTHHPKFLLWNSK